MEYSTQYLHPDELFDQNTKELFLKIPHKVIKINPKIELIDFDVPENGKYPLLSRNQMIKIVEPLTKKEEMDMEIRKHFYSSQYGYGLNDEVGYFIKSNHGSSIENFIKELYKHDEKNANQLLDLYQNFALNCSDIISIEENLIRQLNQLTSYLSKEKIMVDDYDIDYVNYSKKSTDEQQKIIDELYKQYGKGNSFPAYNDLDYMPFMNKDDLYIYDSSGARIYIVKNENESQKVYMINRVWSDMDDGMNEFAYDHQQIYLLLAKQLTPAHLIGEIKDGILIKASLNLTTFNLIQSFVVNELYEEGKIENTIPKLSFEDLLNNYTLQKEIYHLQERAFLEIFKDLKLVNNVLTYDGFSLMKNHENIKHEDFSVHIAKDLLKNLQKKETFKLKDLPEEYKQQINQYLNNLTEKYDNETTHLIVQYVRNEMDNVTKKLKMR